MSKPKFIVQICPYEGVADPCLMNGKAISDDAVIAEALADCCKSGDVQPACEYVRDQMDIEWRIVARNAAGEYENRLATFEEKARTAREIYFESEADFGDESIVDMYLIWQAANMAEQDEES